MNKSQVSQVTGKKVLVTTDCWFTAPDGENYNSVYGELIGVHSDADTLGIKTNAKSTNWYAQVGRMIVAGCQIHYAINCDGVDVNFGKSTQEATHEGKCITSKRPSRIYNADF